jgi:2-polyprenyl-3-methyl-5-hydroxy-6-metoxy-1,4-benzoquinol methylase
VHAQHKVENYESVFVKLWCILQPDPATAAAPLYADAGPLVRALTWGRPYICPFGPLLPWVPQGASVLDIGCGTGLWLLTLAMTGRITGGVGCDPNDAAIAVARLAAKRLPAGPPPSGLTFRATAEDWPQEAFDVVSLVDVLHHIPRAAQPSFLRSAWLNVRPGGCLIYKDMADRPWPFAAANALHDLVLARQVIRYLPIEEAEAVLQAEGARVLHRSAWRRAFYAHELLVVQKR